jgi:nitrite reductase/ring-hydroxylating ferredoxin subunit
MTTISKEDHNDRYTFAANMSNLQESRCLSMQIQNHIIALFYHNSNVYAVDNRCPHMGFPLNQGTVKDGILTCHWHHARFDLNSGGTFDQWAGDVRSYPVEIRNENEIWVDVSSSSSADVKSDYQVLLQNGLKQNIQLMIAKAVIAIREGYESGIDNSDSGLLNAFRIGVDFGTRYKQSGWGQGLTTLTCMMNIIPYLDSQDRPHALYHGLCAVAQDCASMPARFEVLPLPEPWPELAMLKRWFRQFIESRDSQAAERCISTAVRLGANSQQMADMLFAAATDHRFIDVGHTLDFTNKALEALDKLGWENNKTIVESVLTSLVPGYATAERMEESSSWRYPIDIVTMLENAFKELPRVLENGNRIREKRTLTLQQETKEGNNDSDNGTNPKQNWDINDRDRSEVVTVLLGDNPQSIVNALLDKLSQGTTEEELARVVCFAAALRITQFHTRNEFSDWDATLHTFTFANAVHQGLRRIATPELLRGVFDAAMRIYLNRFLNIPAATIPKRSINDKTNDTKAILKELAELLDKQQRVNEAGQLVADYLYAGGNPRQLMSILGQLLMREDRNFHSIQMIEAAYGQYSLLANEGDGNNSARVHILLAASRYLAAHSPTMRSQGRTYQIATQLYHGEQLFE